MDSEELIRRHLPLADAIARRYVGRGEPLEDLRQCGAVGLVLAAQRWDPEQGVSFGAYASPLVAGEIRRHLRDHGRLVRLPRTLWEAAGRCRGAMHELTATLGRTPTDREIAAFVGLDPTEVTEALAASAWPAPLGEIEESPVAPPVSDRTAKVLLHLAPAQRRLLELAVVEQRSQRQIAALYGISQAQVSRALSTTIQVIRDRMDDQESPASERVLAG